jgi:hypothetical protein
LVSLGKGFIAGKLQLHLRNRRYLSASLYQSQLEYMSTVLMVFGQVVPMVARNANASAEGRAPNADQDSLRRGVVMDRLSFDDLGQCFVGFVLGADCAHRYVAKYAVDPNGIEQVEILQALVQSLLQFL